MVADSEHQFLSFDTSAAFSRKFPQGTGSLGGTLQFGEVDKLHKLGIKGKGITIGIIDTGVDYRHPALGGGIGPNHKITGGWSWLDDAGNPAQSPDPLATCFGGMHGTHVAGR
jgi:subtilisin family serine protease